MASVPDAIAEPAIPATMAAVLLTGHGGLDKLEYRTDVPVPVPGRDQVLIKVAAAGVNNTDINTRIGWYSKSVTGDTGEASATTPDDVDDDGGWAGKPLEFPRIQGADVCGRIVAVGAGADLDRLGERVIVATMQRAPTGDRPLVTETLGSEFDGGFAQYLVAHRAETHRVDCDWTDVELASIPCAYSTAENMLHRIGVGGGDCVLVTGASGGVGSAAVQLAKRRGAAVIAVAGAAKAAAIAEIGADEVVHRGTDLVVALGHESVDVVVDLVAGPDWPALLDVLRRGGRYVTSGAIAGPIVDLDVRTLYLKDLRLEGATYQDAVVFENLVGYIERGEIRPLVAGTYPLADIAGAQRDFLAKNFVGKLVLIPPADSTG
jgi:NADPH:quinone reductase-like Zn-dependent oxidoreductase